MHTINHLHLYFDDRYMSSTFCFSRDLSPKPAAKRN